MGYTDCVRYKCQDIEALYGIAPSTFRYWRAKLVGLSEHRQEGLFFAEVVAIGFLAHLIRRHRFRICDLAQVYPQLVKMAFEDNLDRLRASWVMVSAAGDRVMLLPRSESTDPYHLDWEKIDAASFLDKLDTHMKSSDGLLETWGPENSDFLKRTQTTGLGYVNDN